MPRKDGESSPRILRKRRLKRAARHRSRALRRRHARNWPYPGTYVPGNIVDVYYGGESLYADMLDAIGGARHSVHLETYLLRSDAIGWAFAEALASRAKEGVECAFMFDSVGAMPVSSVYLNFLRESEVELLEYHPVWPWRRRFNLSRRNHRKILSIDGEVAFVGGMNISDHAMPKDRGGDGWLDVHLRLRGPVAVGLDRLFVEEWARQGGPELRSQEVAAGRPDGVPVRVVENRQYLRRTMIRSSYMDALRHAKERIWIMNGYFSPDRRFVRALVAAAGRGIDVRIIVPGRSDVRPVMWAGQHIYPRLLSAGVRLFEWTGSVLHAKMAVVDGRWLTIGTYNLNHRSLRYNIEVNAMILSTELASKVESSLAEIESESIELRAESWLERPLFARLRSWFFYLFRAWL